MKWMKMTCAAALAGLLLFSCATVAHVEKDDTVNFSGYRTYAWVAPESDSVKTKLSDLSERTLQQAVAAELAKAGWRESKKADILLTYDYSVDATTQRSNDAVYSTPTTRWFYNPYTRRMMSVYYPSEFLGFNNRERRVKEGTLRLSMVDAKTEKTVWQGWTTYELANKNTSSKELQAGVKSILRKLDVAKN